MAAANCPAARGPGRRGPRQAHVGHGVQWPRQADEAARGCSGPPMCLARAKGGQSPLSYNHQLNGSQAGPHWVGVQLLGEPAINH